MGDAGQGVDGGASVVRAPAMRASVVGASMVLALAACGRGPGSSAAEPSRRYVLGRAASPELIRARDVDVAPDGEGLPAGNGSTADGAKIFAVKCASCHGTSGEGMPPAYPALISPQPAPTNFIFSSDFTAARTIGNFWPYATTVFDYIRRAMPHTAPGSLSNDEVYALTAWLLAANHVIAADATLDAKSLVAVKMPNASRFVRDNRRGGRELR